MPVPSDHFNNGWFSLAAGTAVSFRDDNHAHLKMSAFPVSPVCQAGAGADLLPLDKSLCSTKEGTHG
jgi:hypothetical protein